MSAALRVVAAPLPVTHADADVADLERAVLADEAAAKGQWFTPPEMVQAVAQMAAALAPLPEDAIRAAILAGRVPRAMLDDIADGWPGVHGGGEAGRLWAEDEIRRVHPFAWMVRGEDPDTEAGRSEWWHGWIRAYHGPAERRVAAQAARWLRAWRDAVVDRVAVLMGAREVRDIVSDILGATEAAADFRKTVGPTLEKVIELAFKSAAKEMALSGSLSWDPVIGTAGQGIGALVTNVVQTTRDRVEGIIRAGAAEGWTTAEMQQALMTDPAFGRARALTIARTETGRLSTTGTNEAIQQAQALGVSVEREWVTARDEAVRPSHRALDGDKTTALDPWTFPSGIPTQGPGQSGVAAEDINCRCAVRPRIKRESKP